MLDMILKERIKGFYMGKLYPAVICALIFLGYALSIEVFLLPVIVLAAGFSFWICDSVRPLLVPLCTFLFALSNENSMFGDIGSDYYTTGWRLVVFIMLIIFVAVSLVAFLRRIQLVQKLIRRKTPLILSLLLLSSAFMLNGSGSEKWVIGNVIYGSFQVISFLIVFVLFYHGFADYETADELGDYFSYVTVLMSLLLIGEMLLLYLTNPDLIQNGEILKEKIVFGWGISNNAGFYISVLIPMNLYRAYRSRVSIIPFLVATATWVAAILTLSRNALVWSSIAYAGCLICFMLFGKRKIFFRYAALTTLLCLGVAFLVYHEVVMTALTNYSVQGMGDSGRFKIWKLGLQKLSEAPIFGNGFHGDLVTGDKTATFIPTMAHNTLVQLLYSMGIFGFAAYFIYRIRTVFLFIKRPSMLKTMLAASILVLLGASLLDNFIFHIQPVFYYSIAMAIVCRKNNEDVPCRFYIKEWR